MVDEQEIGRRVKASIVGVIRGTGEVAQTVQTTLVQGGETGSAAAQLGVGAVKGAIHAVGDVGGQATETAADTVGKAVDSASKGRRLRGQRRQGRRHRRRPRLLGGGGGVAGGRERHEPQRRQ